MCAGVSSLLLRTFLSRTRSFFFSRSSIIVFLSDVKIDGALDESTMSSNGDFNALLFFSYSRRRKPERDGKNAVHPVEISRRIPCRGFARYRRSRRLSSSPSMYFSSLQMMSLFAHMQTMNMHAVLRLYLGFLRVSYGYQCCFGEGNDEREREGKNAHGPQRFCSTLVMQRLDRVRELSAFSPPPPPPSSSYFNLSSTYRR